MGMITPGGEVEISIVGRLEGLNRSVNEAEKMLGERFGTISRQTGMAMTAMGGAIVGALGVSVNSAADFEQALKNAVSVTGLSGEAAATAEAQMNALAMTLGQKTAFSASEVANGFYDLNSKGFNAATMSVEELLPFLNLASATQSELGRTTEIITSTLRGFAMQNSDSARIADVFTAAIGGSAANMEKLGQSFPIAGAAAKATGVSFEETTAALALLYDNGIMASTAATGLRNIMMDMTNGSKPLRDALDDVGLKVKDLDLKNKGLAGAFDVMRGAGMSTTQILQAFGKENGVVASILFDGGEKMKSFTGELGNVGGRAEQVAEQQLQTLSGQLQILWGSMETLAITIGQAIIPAFTSLVSSVTPTINAIVEWAKQNPELTKTLVAIAAAVGGLMLVLGPLLIMLPGLVAASGLVSGALAVIPAVAAAAASGLLAFMAPVVAITGAVLAAGYAVASLIGWLRQLGSEQAAVQAPSFGFPMPEGMATGGVVGLPGYGMGGRIGRDLEAFRWNERGGEIAVAPVGSRILTHGESVAVARDAIAAAMGGGDEGRGGGEGMTVNISIERPVVTDRAELERIAREVEGALDRAWAKRAAWGKI